jgi:hypothetical protein
MALWRRTGGDRVDLTWGGVDALLGDSLVPASDPGLADFLAHKTVVRLIEVLVARHCKSYGLTFGPGGYSDDVRSEIVVVALTILTNPEVAARARSKKDFPTALHFLSKDRIKQLRESPWFNGFTGMSSMHRRRRSLLALRAELTATWGREPGVGELIDLYNARVRERRADAARQGALARAADLVDPDKCRVDVSDLVHSDPCATTDIYPVVEPTATYLIDLVVARAQQGEDALLAAVAEALLLPAVRTGVFATSAAVAKSVGVQEGVVEDCRKELHRLAVTILREECGMP